MSSSGAIVLTARVRSQEAASVSWMVPVVITAALLTTASRRPNDRTARSTSRPGQPACVSSSTWPTARPPPISATTLGTRSASSPWITSLAPSAAARTAIARPMPVALPLTTMTLPSSRMAVTRG